MPRLRGDSVAAQQADFAEHWDHLRTAVTLEPRGGALTSSAVLVPPTDPSADLGVFFMEPFGYPAMCGSDTISLVTALIETGQITTAGTAATVRLDTPAGLVTAEACIEPSGVESVTFTNVPGFLALADVPVHVPGPGELVVDVAYGGNFYVLVGVTTGGRSTEAHSGMDALRAIRQEPGAAANPPLVVSRVLNPSSVTLAARGCRPPGYGAG